MQFAGDIPLVLIGNNVDKVDEKSWVIYREECKKYAESQGSVYFETSSTQRNVFEIALMILTKKIVGH